MINQMSSKNIAMLPRLVRVALLFLLSMGLALGWVGQFVSPSFAIAVADVPNPREANGGWVTDMADLLSDEGEQQLNQIIGELEASNGSEIAVVTVLDTQPSATPKAFATELFNTWGIGKASEDNGVLFLVSKSERRTEIETGYGVESLLTDAQAGQILRKQVTPAFKQGNFEVGIVNGVGAIAERLQPIAQSESVGGDRPAVSPVSSPSPAAKETGWFARWFTSSNVFFLVILAVYWVSQRLKFPSPLGLMPPTGRTEIAPRSGLYDVWLAMLRSWGSVGANGASDHPLPMQELTERRLAKALAWLGSGIVLIAMLSFASVRPLSSFYISLLALAWLCLESWLSYATAFWRRDAGPAVPLLSTAAASCLFFAIVALVAVFYLLFLAVALFFSLFMGTWIIGLPCGVFATFALGLRWRRQQYASPRCQVCARRDGLKAAKLRRLSLTELRPHLSQTEQLEMMQYEAYHCPVCHPFSATPTDGFQLHLFSNHLLNGKYKDCPACQAKTLEVKNILTKAPSKRGDGKQLTQQHCHRCDYHQEETKDVKYSKPVKRSSRGGFSRRRSWGSGDSSGGYSGGGYSGGGYSGGSSGGGYSSGGSDGGDFGGGESGGGGAGEGW